MIHFLITFILLILLGSFLIVQFYHLSRHYIIVEPDGSETIGGFVLKFWSRFWERKVGVRSVVYSGDSLEYKFNELNRRLNPIGRKFVLNPGKKSMSLRPGETITPDEKDKIKKITPCELYVNGSNYFLLIEEDLYYFKEWVRKPISACPVCMSSVFGSIIWFTFLYLSPNLFSWSAHPVKCIFLFYIVFLLLLSGVNSIIYKKTIQFV